MTNEQDEVRAELLQVRLRWHAEAAPASAAAALLAGATLASLLVAATGATGPAAMAGPLAWVAVLVAVLALRVGLAWATRRALAPGAPLPPTWLRRHRLSFGLHGAVWAAVLLLVPDGPVTLLQTPVYIVTAMTGAVLVVGAFDPVATRAFTALPLLALASLLGGLTGPAQPELALVCLVFVVVMGLAGHRTGGMLERETRARVAERRLHAEAERAREAAGEQDALLRQLIHDTQQGFWHIDPQGRTVDLNPAMCALLGRPREQVLGRAVFDFFSGPERAQMERELEQRRRGHAGGYESDVVRPDGSRRHAYNQATPVYDRIGRHLGSIGLWTDLSAQKALELELRVYERITNSITDLLAVVGRDRRYLVVNDAWCDAWAMPRERVLGGPVGLENGGSADPDLAQALEACFERGSVATVATRTWLPAGRDARLQTTLFPYRDGGATVQRVILVTRDVTEQERSREAEEVTAQALRTTLNATDDAIFASDAADPDEPVRFANDPLIALFGLMRAGDELPTPRQIMAAALPMFEDPEEEKRRIQRMIRLNERGDHRVRLRDGRVLARRCEPAWVAGRWLRVWSFRDVSSEERVRALLQEREAEQRALAAAEAEQRALLQVFPGIIGVVDEDDRYVYANAGLAQELGVDADALIGRHVRDVLGEERFHAVKLEADRARAGELVKGERRNPPNARRGRLDVDVTHVAGPRRADGRRLCYVFGIDVTDRNLAQEALAAARDEAERANRAKSQFLSHVSHELRTPLNAIAGFAQLLKRDAEPPLPEHQRGWTRQILRASEHLLSLINEVLDLSSIESGRLRVERQSVELAGAVEEATALVQALARERGVQLLPPLGLDTAPPLVALADRRRLRQVLLNLLGNAIKYNVSGGTVQIACRRDGDTVVVEVRDTGRGIALADQSRLFTPFERLDAARGAVEGTGIGLALCRRLVEAMGGSIALESTPGRGSRFGVRLPAGTDPVAAPRATRLIYVDDNEVNLMLVQALARSAPGLQVQTFERADEGLRRAADERPDLVLMDLHMPGMDGFAALAALRADPATAAIPVVALTADSSPADLERALAAGFADVLTKPLDLDRLLQTMARLTVTDAVPDSPP